ncbi:cell surface receptor IPT/TIG domain-containing protein [Crassaminicella thermophila]|uniref:Cell surface receptor IPT/TIG domain-containing protein n=1 Tax=Crassaminicella thermophila TaxID=2599308 RepID=A0A5C0SGE0_CRATE|nr:IPT/TIG domain-containing protein [Crassaminicella thermophila]QEK13260.1 cell surface receptor IPT/TIG domain-containing protein [Crassaminicella thermophila]
MAKKLLEKCTIFFVVFAMVFGMMPWNDITALAAYDPDKYYIDHMAITKIYDDGGYIVKQTKLTIKGRYLQGIEVSTFTSTGTVVLKNPIVNFDTVQEFVVDGDIVGNSINVGNISIPIEQDELPTLLGIDKRSVKIGYDDINITGSNLGKIYTNPQEYSAYYQNTLGAGGDNVLSSEYFNGTVSGSVYSVNIPKEEIKGVAGPQNIVLKKEKKIYVDFHNNNDLVIKDGEHIGENEVTVTIQNTYLEQFTLVDTIKTENLVMNPNRGRPGDEVIFMATSGLDDYDVFFLEKLTDKYTDENKGKNTSFDPDIDGRQVLTTHVPEGLKQGDYFVVLTNKIPSGEDPEKSINKQLVIGQAPNYEKFTIIDAEQKIKIYAIEPNQGPDSGSKVELSGVFFGSLNTPKFILDDPNNPIKSVKMLENVDGSTNEMTMEIEYSSGTYDGIPVESAKRRLKVIIGSVAKFAKKPDGSDYEYTFTNSLDRISVLTQSVTDAETDPIKDVVVETETTFKLEGFPNNIVIKDRAELKDGYTFIPSKIRPKIEGVIPEKIQVIKISDAPVSYKISEDYDRLIAIYGKDFFIHRYIDDSGNEVVRYPIIEFGNGIRLNKNNNGEDSNQNLYLKVFNIQGNEIDGSEGNEIGTKILVKIPKDITMDTIGKTTLKVINPVRNSDNEGLYDNKQDAVEFVVPAENKKPVIESVNPNVVTVEGGEEVTIIGSNFQDGVKVIIDGKEVQGIKPQGDGKKIIFTAPPGREGETHLQVMNLEGGIAIFPFRYVKTYTDPKLTDFSPKEGKTETLVVVEGDNFLKPDPTATTEDIYKLIGTRILLEGEDINDYNIHDVTKQIILKEYKGPNKTSYDEIGKILRVADNKLKLEDYYHSVILEDTKNPKKFYTIDKNMQNEIILSNGMDKKYTISQSGNDIKAYKYGGGVYTVNVVEYEKYDVLRLTNDSDTNDVLELKLLTPFKVDENNIIIGDRVKVVDMHKLYFTVPILPGDGYYDVTVENPDTKKDSKVDTQGFYYYTQPSSKPNILSIEPDIGSVDGGYKITIKGERIDGRECFVDNGIKKTKVTINGKLVPNEDITVSVDGTSLEVVVPKLDIDLKEEYKTDRLTVPVVIVNPDGGSASKEDGFTYIVPISHPEINKISPTKGKAAGGNYVEIEGDKFNFYEPYNDVNRNGNWDIGENYEDLNDYSVNLGGKDDEKKGGPDDFTGKNVDELKEAYKDQYDKIVRPVLPKVYFDGKQAEIVEFGNGYIKVIAPKGVAGPVDVYVINNDSGISNKVTYTYEASNPVISTISPDGGKKQGRDRVEIHGEDFYPSDINVYYKDGDNYKTKTESQVLVRFGEITNKYMPREAENAGRIDVGRTTIRLDGGLTVDYNGIENTLKLSILENKENYTVTLPYNDEIVYVPVSLLTFTDDKGEAHSYVNANRGDEWIRFEVSDRRLFVERGYSPKVEYITTKHIVVHTPSYYTVGIVPLTVINSDGGEATKNFEYKNPDSKPIITNITKDGKDPVLEKIEEKEIKILRMTYKGGNTVSIIGSDFRENATIQIGNILIIQPNQITYQLPNKLTFEMPSVAEENVGALFRVVVSNEDYGNVASDELSPPIYIQFTKGETSPSIEEMIPDKGPSSGGTSVTIKGKDFREGLSLFIGDVEVPKENVKVIDYKTIKIITPPHEPGKFEVKVENPDGELSTSMKEFTYLSAPTIVSVVDPNDPAQTSLITSISVEGGEEIKIKGSGFVEGTRVVFAPVIEKSNGEDSEIIYIKGEGYKLLEGKDGTEVRFIDEGTIVVKTPAGKLDKVGIIVINPDGGASKIYEDIRYGLPELSVPTDVSAQLVYDRYIKITWNKVEGAKEYEIYVVIDDNERYVIGNTELTSFIYEDLEPNTEYRFVVTAVGDFGGSKYSEESNEVETGRKVGPEDEDGELGENTKTEKIGNQVKIIIGEDDYQKMRKIDLTRGDLAGAKEVTISIPSSVVSSIDAKDITIIGQDFVVKFNPNTFYSSKVKENKRKRDSGVRFYVGPEMKNTNVEGKKGEVVLSNEYMLKAWLYVEEDSTEIIDLPSYMQITLDVDREKAKLRRVKYMNLSYYDGEQKSWIPIAKGNSSSYSVMGLTNKLGKFAVVGSRR